MKKVFMEPEVKVTKFEYEDIMNVDITSSPEVVGPRWIRGNAGEETLDFLEKQKGALCSRPKPIKSQRAM